MIDLRSDTVTRPTPAMREAMARAEVGDDVWGDDPTVARLEAQAAELLGKEAALFLPSGTQSNLVALMTHCQRGDEYLVGQDAHTYKYEGGGAAVLGSIQPQPLSLARDGSIPLDSLRAAIKPDDFHFARTRLLCLENTIGGRVLPHDYTLAACNLAASHGLARHLDGARLFNAAVRSGMPVAELAAPFDSVSICLSKGLGAPVGSVLCASRDFIREAKRWRKMLGGGMRQSGILAAAGIYALEHNVGRLAEDHDNAALLAEGLADLPGVVLDRAEVQTNMVFFDVPAALREAFIAELHAQDILVDAGARIRAVTHMQVSADDIRRTLACIHAFFDRNPT